MFGVWTGPHPGAAGEALTISKDELTLSVWQKGTLTNVSDLGSLCHRSDH